MAATWKEIGYYENAVALSSETPEAVGTTADDGDGTAASRYNHVHILGDGAIDSTTFFADNIVDGTALANDSVNAAELAAFTGNVDANDQEFKNMVVHKAATTPPTAVKGKIFYDTDAGKLYVCTSAT